MGRDHLRGLREWEQDAFTSEALWAIAKVALQKRVKIYSFSMLFRIPEGFEDVPVSHG